MKPSTLDPAVSIEAPAEPPTPGPRHSFAHLSTEERQAMAARGGRAAWSAGKAHVWTREEAREAGLRSARRRKEQREAASVAS